MKHGRECFGVATETAGHSPLKPARALLSYQRGKRGCMTEKRENVGDDFGSENINDDLDAYLKASEEERLNAIEIKGFPRLTYFLKHPEDKNAEIEATEEVCTLPCDFCNFDFFNCLDGTDLTEIISFHGAWENENNNSDIAIVLRRLVSIYYCVSPRKAFGGLQYLQGLYGDAVAIRKYLAIPGETVAVKNKVTLLEWCKRNFPVPLASASVIAEIVNAHKNCTSPTWGLSDDEQMINIKAFGKTVEDRLARSLSYDYTELIYCIFEFHAREIGRYPDNPDECFYVNVCLPTLLNARYSFGYLHGLEAKCATTKNKKIKKKCLHERVDRMLLVAKAHNGKKNQKDCEGPSDVINCIDDKKVKKNLAELLEKERIKKGKEKNPVSDAEIARLSLIDFKEKLSPEKRFFYYQKAFQVN